MAVKKNKANPGEKVWPVPPETIVDVVSTKDTRVIVTPMRYDAAVSLIAKNGWKNNIYQQGYHTYKTTPKNDTT